jgi:iron complex outermembrane receptor protein
VHREKFLNRESGSAVIFFAVLAGFALSPLPAAFAQTAPSAASPNPTQELQEVEVTGTLIRSTVRSEFNQVQVISAEDLARSGEVTVADYLRDLAVNSASSWADNFAYGA